MHLPGLNLITPERRERVSQFRKTVDKARCLAAGLLMRKYAGHGEPLLGSHGKPYFENGPHFSLSHAGSYAMIAISNDPVGADVEKHRIWNERIAKRVLLPRELAWLASREDTDTAFFTLWTAKESIMKATGAGFNMSPRTIEADPVNEVGQDSMGRTWQLCWRVLPEHTLCAAYSGKERDVEWSLVDPADLLLA